MCVCVASPPLPPHKLLITEPERRMRHMSARSNNVVFTQLQLQRSRRKTVTRMQVTRSFPWHTHMHAQVDKNTSFFFSKLSSSLIFIHHVVRFYLLGHRYAKLKKCTKKKKKQFPLILQVVQHYLSCGFRLGKARWPPSKLVHLVNMHKHSRGSREHTHTRCNVLMSMSSLLAKIHRASLSLTPTHLIHSRCV